MVKVSLKEGKVILEEVTKATHKEVSNKTIQVWVIDSLSSSIKRVNDMATSTILPNISVTRVINNQLNNSNIKGEKIAVMPTITRIITTINNLITSPNILMVRSPAKAPNPRTATVEIGLTIISSVRGVSNHKILPHRLVLTLLKEVLLQPINHSLNTLKSNSIVTIIITTSNINIKGAQLLKTVATMEASYPSTLSNNNPFRRNDEAAVAVEASHWSVDGLKIAYAPALPKVKRNLSSITNSSNSRLNTRITATTITMEQVTTVRLHPTPPPTVATEKIIQLEYSRKPRDTPAQPIRTKLTERGHKSH